MTLRSLVLRGLLPGAGLLLAAVLASLLLGAGEVGPGAPWPPCSAGRTAMPVSPCWNCGCRAPWSRSPSAWLWASREPCSRRPPATPWPNRACWG
ncbi:hypothetical protein ACR6C2_44830 [Streptomyces sp. INA 01156]